MLALSALQPTLISILDVYQRYDPGSATQDYSSASFAIQQGEGGGRKDPETYKKRDLSPDDLSQMPPELIPFRANLINSPKVAVLTCIDGTDKFEAASSCKSSPPLFV